jgi:hypothetical protein
MQTGKVSSKQARTSTEIVASSTPDLKQVVNAMQGVNIEKPVHPGMNCWL